jgi:hypothetical protein
MAIGLNKKTVLGDVVDGVVVEVRWCWLGGGVGLDRSRAWELRSVKSALAKTWV